MPPIDFCIAKDNPGQCVALVLPASRWSASRIGWAGLNSTLNRRWGYPLLLLVTAVGSAAGDDWPQWRGPTRDGVWHESGVVERFDGPDLEIRWRASISSGYSGPTVAGGRVYVSDRVVNGTEQFERVHCFGALTGQKIWSHSYPCSYENVGKPAGPRGSVTIDQDRAYSLGTMGHLICFDATSGVVRWKKDMAERYRIRMPTWGIACSPLVEDNLLIAQIGGADGACLVALDKTTGGERWRALPDPASYSSPIVIHQAGRRILVCWTGARVVGLDPQTGRLCWEYPTPPKSFVRACASPVWKGDRLLLSSFFEGALMLRLPDDRLAVEKVWHRVGPTEQETDGLHTNIAEPLMEGDHIYGVDSYGQLRCLASDTGERIWERLDVVPIRRWSTLRFIPNADKVWIFTDRGELIISRLSPGGYEQISRSKLIKPTRVQLRRRDGVCWAHPAFANGHVYARNDQQLVCARLLADER